MELKKLAEAVFDVVHLGAVGEVKQAVGLFEAGVTSEGIRPAYALSAAFFDNPRSQLAFEIMNELAALRQQLLADLVPLKGGIAQVFADLGPEVFCAEVCRFKQFFPEICEAHERSFSWWDGTLCGMHDRKVVHEYANKR